MQPLNPIGAATCRRPRSFCPNRHHTPPPTQKNQKKKTGAPIFPCRIYSPSSISHLIQRYHFRTLSKAARPSRGQKKPSPNVINRVNLRAEKFGRFGHRAPHRARLLQQIRNPRNQTARPPAAHPGNLANLARCGGGFNLARAPHRTKKKSAAPARAPKAPPPKNTPAQMAKCPQTGIEKDGGRLGLKASNPPANKSHQILYQKYKSYIRQANTNERKKT